MKLDIRRSVTSLILISLALTAHATAYQSTATTTADCESPNKNLLLLNVTVTNKKGRFAQNLAAENFTVLAKNRPQKIDYFCPRERPSSIGILLDVSGSMKALNDGRVPTYTKENLLRFVKQLSPSVEYFVIAFGERMEMIEWTTSPDLLKKGLDQVNLIKGSTPLYDAVFAGLEALNKHTANRKKALVLLSDGMDNNSKHKFEEILKILKASDVLFYGINYVDGVQATLDGFMPTGERALREFASVTGGFEFSAHNRKAIIGAFDSIAQELRSQYSIGFLQRGPADEWQHLSVRIKPMLLADPDNPAEAPSLKQLNGRTREGFWPRQ